MDLLSERQQGSALPDLLPPAKLGELRSLEVPFESAGTDLDFTVEQVQGVVAERPFPTADSGETHP